MIELGIAFAVGAAVGFRFARLYGPQARRRAPLRFAAGDLVYFSIGRGGQLFRGVVVSVDADEALPYVCEASNIGTYAGVAADLIRPRSAKPVRAMASHSRKDAS